MAAGKNETPSFNDLLDGRNPSKPRHYWSPEELTLMAILGCWLLVGLVIWWLATPH